MLSVDADGPVADCLLGLSQLMGVSAAVESEADDLPDVEQRVDEYECGME